MDFFIFLIAVILVYAIFHFALSKSSVNKVKKAPQDLPIKKQDYTNLIYSRIIKAFSEIGWTVWDESVHKADGQYERMERAASDKVMIVLSFDNTNHSARVLGTEGIAYEVDGFGCTCPDYQYRKLPCKHMYFIVMQYDELKSKSSPSSVQVKIDEKVSKEMILTTSQNIEGRKISNYLGVVSAASILVLPGGNAAIQRGWLAGVDTVNGILVEQASELDADAIIAISYLTFGSQLCATGTAVTLTD